MSDGLGRFVDVHSHVLPGVDDGAPDVPTSLELLRIAAEAGTSDIVATPHQHPGRYPNSAERLRVAYQALLDAREAAVQAGETLPRVHLGAEVHLDADLPRLLLEGERLTLAGGPHVLFELPDVFPLDAVEHALHEMQLAGFTPVLAHPERIGQIVRRPELLDRLVSLGALSQLTAMSVTGDFGSECRSLSERFLRRGLVHAVASDAHDPKRRRPTLARARQALEESLGASAARLLLEDNPRALLEGRSVEALPPAPPPPRRRTLAERLRRLLGS